MIIGLVGKPSSGKSTFFKACTLAEVDIADYPFTTIKPNQGIGYLKIDCPCKELGVKCEPNNSYCVEGNRFVPVKMLDVAGLVPGAHKGKGLGNKFLDDLRNADCLIHIIDLSGTTNEKGEKTKNYNPKKDVEFLKREIDLWFTNIIKKNFVKTAKSIRHSKKPLLPIISEGLSGLKISEGDIKKSLKKTGFDIKKVLDWEINNFLELAKTLRKTSKPMILAGNKIDMKNSEENIKKFDNIIPCSALSELVLRELDKNNKISYVPGESDFKIIKKEKLVKKETKALSMIKEKVLKKYGSTGVQTALNHAGFELLKLKVVYPVENENKYCNNKGKVLPDAILLEKDGTAFDLAKKVHTDLAEGFVKAINCRTGRTIGKNTVLNNGDVIKIHSTK